MIQLANGKRSAPNVVAHSGHGMRAVRQLPAWVVLIRCRLRRCGRGLRPRECVTVSKTTASYHRCTVYPSGPWPRRALPSGPCSRRCSVSTGTPNLNLIQVHCPSRSSFCECGVAAGGLDVAIVGMCRGYACQKGFHCFFVLLSSFLDVFGFAANDAFAISMVLWLLDAPMAKMCG